jgi:hypothetical protein
VLRETTSRGLCGLVCPSRTSERGGEGDCGERVASENLRCILNNPAQQQIFLKASLRNHVTSRDSVSLHFTTSLGGSGE